MDSLPSHPIGVFDSGVGGLTVVRALMERLPFEDIVYFGDTARVPYGVKSVDTIKHFTGQITEFLLEKNVKLLIIACNTMAAVAADVVKQLALDVPVLDVIEAGARNAVAQTRSNAIGVIGTPTTVNSNAYARSIHHLNPGVRVYSQACPLFVPLVEEGWLDHPVTRLTAQEYLKPVLVEKIDTLVLGCTHYPFLAELIRQQLPGHIDIIEPSPAVVRQTLRLLPEGHAANVCRSQYRFISTGSGDSMPRFLQQVLHRNDAVEFLTL